MSTTCPKCGAASATSDYCDQCGAVLAPPPPAGPPAAAPIAAPVPERTCPACGHPADPAAAFCESCGCDLTTGAMPRFPSPLPQPEVAAGTRDAVPTAWELVVSVDPERWATHADLRGEEPMPGEVVVPLVTSVVTIGRTSKSRGTVPDIDVTAANGDPAVSHRHCSVERGAGDGWWVRDLGSQNGTHVAGVEVSVPTALGDGAVVEIGAWTALTLRART